MGAMARGLLKLVLVALLRRSLAFLNVWVERFSMLGDPQIARAFAEMAARPVAPHTVQSLSQLAATIGACIAGLNKGSDRILHDRCLHLGKTRDNLSRLVGQR